MNALRNEFSFIASHPVSISKLAETWSVCSGGSASWEALPYLQACFFSISSPIESKHKNIFQAVFIADDQRISLKYVQVQLYFRK